MNQTIRKILIVAIVFIVAGGIIYRYGIERGGKLFSYTDKNGISIGVNVNSTYEVESYTYTIKNNIQSLVLDLSMGDFNIYPSTTNESYIVVDEMKTDVTTIVEDEETLKVSTTRYPSSFSLNNKYKNEISVYLTKTDLENVIIELAMTDFTMKDCTATNMDITLNMGSVKLDNIASDDLSLSVNMGEIEYNGTTNKGNFTTSMGDIRVNLNDTPLNYNYLFDVSMGDIKLNGESYKNFQYKDNYTKEDKYIDIKTRMGSVEVNFNE